MSHMTPLEERIYNEGERLIPGVTHDLDEVRRHKSSYVFWKRIIEHDLNTLPNLPRPVRILDLGAGVGHGCATLAEIPGVEVVGIDNSPDSLEYARLHYNAPNIHYEVGDIIRYLETMPAFDYIVSRGVIEHIPDGINRMLAARWTYRLLFDVPYEEDYGNPHHVLHFINEDHFKDFPNAELFFQDLQGMMYDLTAKQTAEARLNMIMCVASAPEMPRVAEMALDYPIEVWTPDGDDTLLQRYADLQAAHQVAQQPMQPPIVEVEPEAPAPDNPLQQYPEPTFMQKVIGKIKRILRERSTRGAS